MTADLPRPFFDVHGHCAAAHGFAPGGVAYECTPDELLRLYDRHGIARGVLMPELNPEASFRSQSNEEVLAIAAAHPDRFVPFCNVDPRMAGLGREAPFEEVLRHYRDLGCRGLGEVCARLPFRDDRVQALLAAAEKVGFPVTFHLAAADRDGFYGLVDEPGLPQLEESLRRFPKLRFFGHSQPFWFELAAYPAGADRNAYPEGPVGEEGALVRLLRTYPNLYGDLSAQSGARALTRDRAYAAAFLEEFQDRLMFGLDMCCPRAPSSTDPALPPFLRSLRDAGDISETVFGKVARGNALRELGFGIMAG